MGFIADMSKFQDDTKIDWPTFSKNVDLLILRVQYGSTVPDSQYIDHAINATKYKVPFLTYAFPEFVSVNDARVEANNASSRKHPNSRGIVIDIETEYKNGSPAGITKLSQQIRIDGIKAYVDQLRQKGEKLVGAYIGNNVYEAWGMAAIVSIFDFVWIAKYSTNKPCYPCDLWQYTDSGSIAGYNGPLDISTLTGSKPLSFFTGIQPVSPSGPNVDPVAAQFCTKTKVLMTLRVDGPTDIRTAPSHSAGYVRNTQLSEVFHVFDRVKDVNGHMWDNVGGANWVDEASGVFYWLDNPALKQTQNAPKYYTVKKGDIASVIAANAGITLKQLDDWNNLNSDYLIRIGQVLRIG